MATPAAITMAMSFRHFWPGAESLGARRMARRTKSAQFPADRPVTAGDFAATLYHALGIPPATEIADRFGRPLRVADGAPVWELLS